LIPGKGVRSNVFGQCFSCWGNQEIVPGTFFHTVVQTQIKELQTAAVANAESVKGHVRQLEEIMQGLESSATQLQSKITKLVSLLYVSAGVAVIALGCALWALLR